MFLWFLATLTVGIAVGGWAATRYRDAERRVESMISLSLADSRCGWSDCWCATEVSQ